MDREQQKIRKNFEDKHKERYKNCQCPFFRRDIKDNVIYWSSDRLCYLKTLDNSVVSPSDYQ